MAGDQTRPCDCDPTVTGLQRGQRGFVPVTPTTILTALADGLTEYGAMWRQALVDRDEALLDWLGPRFVARARLAAHHALKA